MATEDKILEPTPPLPWKSNLVFQREKERGSHISYMFRLPFAAGSVFSASMLDTLLYQAFVKDYVITFVRLLLGIDQAPGSGFLTSLTTSDLWIRTYGRLYQKLCSTTCEIPIGIYRSQSTSSDEDYYEKDTDTSDRLELRRKSEFGNVYYSPCWDRLKKTTCTAASSSFSSQGLTEELDDSHAQLIERAEISNLIGARLGSLGLPSLLQAEPDSDISLINYVVINPACDLKIREGDIVYLIRPSPVSRKHEGRVEKARDGKEVDHQRRRSSDSSRLRSASSAAAGLSVEDILLRRSNSLRQGLGRRHDEIGLPELRNCVQRADKTESSSLKQMQGTIV